MSVSDTLYHFSAPSCARWTRIDHYAPGSGHPVGTSRARQEIKLASGDYVDLKMFEPAMRHLLDSYIQAEDTEIVSSFDDLGLLDLIIERGPDEAAKALPSGIRKNKDALAETIENNIRRVIIDEQPINPKYYEKMSELLDTLIEQRRQEALDYQEYLEKIVELAKKVQDPAAGESYPTTLNTAPKRALYDNLDKNEALALAVDSAVRASKQDDWRGNHFKIKMVKNKEGIIVPEGAAPRCIHTEVIKRIKPQIPEVGEGGIPIHDEIVLELNIKPSLES